MVLVGCEMTQGDRVWGFLLGWLGLTDVRVKQCLCQKPPPPVLEKQMLAQLGQFQVASLVMKY